MIVVALIQLFVVAFASAGFDEVAEASPFGRPGTAVACALIAVVALVGVVVAWRGAAGALRMIIALVLFASIGIIALMVMFFAVGGGIAIGFAILLILAAIMIGMIGRAVLQWPSSQSPGRPGR